MTTYTATDAIQMLINGGVDLREEITNPTAAYLDIVDDIERDGGEAAFTEDEFLAALREAAVPTGFDALEKNLLADGEVSYSDLEDFGVIDDANDPECMAHVDQQAWDNLARKIGGIETTDRGVRLIR